MQKYLNILVLLLLITACGERQRTNNAQGLEAETIHESFFSNISSLCGETFIGASTFPDDPQHTLVDTELRAHISTCEEDVVNIDLYRDGDTWHATWVVAQRGEGLHLYHDHIGDKDEEEPGEDDLSGYGGYADDHGSSTKQYFPADEATAAMLPEAATNVWMMEMDLENGIFIYYLERHDEPRFRAELTLQ